VARCRGRRAQRRRLPHHHPHLQLLLKQQAAVPALVRRRSLPDLELLRAAVQLGDVHGGVGGEGGGGEEGRLVHARHSGHGVRIGDYDLIMLRK
jgi:hypothetical protein